VIFLSGACYLVNSFAWFLSPAAASRIFPAILILPFVSELSLAAWLVVKRGKAGQDA
jgi:hypothetical protein